MQLNTFEPTKVSHFWSVAIIGDTCIGKTTLIKDLLKHIQCPQVDIMSTTNDVSIEYSSNYNCVQYDERTLSQIIENHSSTHQIPRLLVFDGCWNNVGKVNMKRLFCNGRCMKIKHISTFPQTHILPPIIKYNLDYAFIFDTINPNERKHIYNNFNYMFKSFDDFCRKINVATHSPYSCMVIEMLNTPDKDLSDCVFSYQVDVNWRKIMELKKYALDIIRKELIQKTWHPSRLRWCLSLDDVREIFGKL